jgi:hypothetical protein
MKLDLDLPSGDATPEAELNGTFNFSSDDSLIADVYVPEGVSTDVQLQFVVKSSNDWTWCPSSVTFSPSKAGSWLKYAVATTTFAASDAAKKINLTDVKQILIQFVPASSSYKGTIYIDNVRSKKGSAETVISDFNKTGSAWAEYEVGSADNIQISLAQRPGTTGVRNFVTSKAAVDIDVAVSGKKLIITSAIEGFTKIRILDISGKVIITQKLHNVQGKIRSIDCGWLTPGNYLVELVSDNNTAVSTFSLQ